MAAEKEAHKGLEPLFLLEDEPVRTLEGDHLALAPFARVVAGAALGTPGPFTIGVFAHWGEGKTSVLRLAKSLVDRELGVEHVVTVWFNAWQFEREEHPIVPLIASIVAAVEARRRKLEEEAKTAVQKAAEGTLRGLATISRALRAIAYGFSAKTKVKVPGFAEIESSFVAKEMIERYEKLQGLPGAADPLLERSLYYSAFELLEAVVRPVAPIKSDEGKPPKIVIFVDDLDRCLPPQGLALLESIKLVLTQPGFLFALAVDRRVLESFLRKRYEEEYGMKGYDEDGKLYLDKIVQLPLALPSHESRFAAYLERLLARSSAFQGERNSEVKAALGGMTSVLAAGTDNNPRSLVRFVNNLIVDRNIWRSIAPEEKVGRESLELSIVSRMFQQHLGEGYRDLVRDQPLCEELAVGLQDVLKKRRLGDAKGPLSAFERRQEALLDELDRKPILGYLLESEAGKRWLNSHDERTKVDSFLVTQREASVEAPLSSQPTSLDILDWPALTDAGAFESLCLDLFSDIWGPGSGARLNGRSGQAQAGVDVYGRDPQGRWVGVQCKQRGERLRSRLSVTELEMEVEAARAFEPPLSLFVVATTGPADVALQERARVLSGSSPFRVEVWSWREILLALSDRPALLRRIAWRYWPTILALSGGQKINLGRLPRVSGELFGREEILARLDAAWADPTKHVVTLVAWGGVGKTVLVAEWVARLAARQFDGADVFDWSFYSQGTREEGSASSEPFINAALKFFGGDDGEKIAASPISGSEKGAKLAAFVARRKALLILDGLEPLQYPPSSSLAGQLKDPAVTALLRGLAAQNPGLCVVTTRESVTDLAAFHGGPAPEWSLERLSTTAGVALLEKLQVRGTKKELEALVEEVEGHALTLQLLGSYLRDAHGGDIRQRDLVEIEAADREEQGGHAFRAIAAYENWLGREKEAGARQLAVLRLLGLFDRPADKGCLEALRKEPAIPGLTESLVGISDAQWNLAVSRLGACGLASRSIARAGESQGEGLDAHPLVREYFARQLRDHHPGAWRAAHGRLFEHLRDSTEHWPDTLEGLQPLYQAVAHGCHAGRQQEACDGVYRNRIQRGQEAFSTKKLGAIGADLGAVACFFDPPWRRVSPVLSEADQAWLLNEAATRLRALGRLIEALEPMRVGLEMFVAQESWEQAARIATNLSELELTLGDVPGAVGHAERSVTFADQSGDAFVRMAFRATHADALHQAGRRAEALALFREAEVMQTEWQPEFPRLYSVQGFRYCDLLLAEAERAAGRQVRAGADGAALSEAIREVEERAAQTLQWMGQRLGVLDTALDHLTLGRAALFRSILEGTDPAPARAEIEAAVDLLRRAGTQHMISLGLLIRAWLLHREGHPDAARADLDEAQEIAERGPMPLFLADIALMRARLFGDREALSEARRLIEKHGYGRRLGELTDLEAGLGMAG